MAWLFVQYCASSLVSAAREQLAYAAPSMGWSRPARASLWFCI